MKKDKIKEEVLRMEYAKIGDIEVCLLPTKKNFKMAHKLLDLIEKETSKMGVKNEKR